MKIQVIALCILGSSSLGFAEEIDDGATIWVPGDQLAQEGGNPMISPIIYVNGCWEPPGCEIRAGGYNDARADISTVPTENGILSPFVHSQEVWDDTINCLREVYGPYDVEIVTEDPGDVFHHEAILAGTPQELGLGGDIGGISPGGLGCGPQNNVISFSFANYSPPDWINLCWTVAQESAHAFALDHAFDCRDPMTYIPNCGQKFFRNELLPCGEYEARQCSCTGANQNSHAILTTVLGEGTPPDPPAVAITTPSDGATVAEGFDIEVAASDPRLVHRVELHVNGWLYDTLDGHDYFDRDDPYFFAQPDGLPDGVLDIEVTAYNDLESAATATVTVTKGSPCSSAATCLDGQVCEDGRCFWPPPTGQLGDSCERAMDCVSLLCSEDGEQQLCSEYCLVRLEGQCPDGFECVESGNVGICWPADGEGGGGCCSVGAEKGPTPGQLLLLLLVAGILVRRRAGQGAMDR